MPVLEGGLEVEGIVESVAEGGLEVDGAWEDDGVPEGSLDVEGVVDLDGVAVIEIGVDAGCVYLSLAHDDLHSVATYEFCWSTLRIALV